MMLLRMLLAGIANRVRGMGKLPRWAGMGLVGLSVGLCFSGYYPWWLVLVLSICFAGMLSFGWGSYMDLGRNQLGHEDEPELFDWALAKEKAEWSFTQRWKRDALGLAMRGGIITLVPALIVVLSGQFHPIDFMWAISGVAMPLVYELAYRVPLKIRGLTQGPEFGELLFGIWLAGAALCSVNL